MAHRRQQLALAFDVRCHLIGHGVERDCGVLRTSCGPFSRRARRLPPACDDGRRARELDNGRVTRRAK